MAVKIDSRIFAASRKSRGISQEDLANKGIGRTTIQRIESSEIFYSCQTHTAKKLAEALNLDLEDIRYHGLAEIFSAGGDIEIHITHDTTDEEILEHSKNLLTMFRRIKRAVYNKE